MTTGWAEDEGMGWGRRDHELLNPQAKDMVEGRKEMQEGERWMLWLRGGR